MSYSVRFLTITVLIISILEVLPVNKFFGSSTVKAQTQNTWYMAGANPQRTSWVGSDVQGINGISWYRPIEAYIDQKTQLITANGKVYVSTTKGLVVLDADNGNLKWRFDTELPLANSPTVIGDMVYVAGYDRNVYGIRDLGDNFQVAWQFTGSTDGFSVNPLVVDGVVYIGSRGGYFYAINAGNGSLIWQYPASNQQSLESIMYSAAYDNGVLYFAAQDKYAYALNASNGSQVWKSPQKLQGESLQSWWPVVYGNYVVFPLAPAYKNGTDPGSGSVVSGANIKDIYRDTFYGTSSGRSGNVSSSNGSQGWASGVSLLDTESSPVTNTLSSYFSQNPQLRVFAVLNKDNGQETVTMPFVYSGTYSGNMYPPVVNPQTGGLYANNLTTGSGGNGISRAQPMGWKSGNRYLHILSNVSWAIDEPIAFSGAGSTTYFNLCCDRAAGSISPSRSWWDYGGRLLEQTLPISGSGKYDPMWQKYGEALERLQSYYNGSPGRTNGSESRNGVYNSHGLQNPLIPYVFTNSQGQTVNRIFTHRSNSIIALGTSDTKTSLPLVEINQNPNYQGRTLSTNEITGKLEKEIDKIIDVYDANSGNGFLNPGYYNDGTGVPASLGIPAHYFQSPSDGLYAYSSAYPHISDSNLKSRLQSYLQNFYNRYFGSTPVNAIGWNNQPRELISFPSEVRNSMSSRSDSTSGAFSQRSFYGLWKYAQVFPNQASAIYNSHSQRLSYPSNLSNDTLTRTPHVFNEYIAGYVGFLNLQEMAYAGNYPADVLQLRNGVQSELNSLMSRRSQGFTKDHPWRGESDNPGGIQINNYARQFNLARNFLYITPELGGYFRQNNYSVASGALNEYLYLGPLWFSGRVDNAFQEGIKTNLYDRPALFLAKAYVENAGRSELSKYLDSPSFERGDLFYIQNLVAALNATGDGSEPTPTQGVLNTPTPIPVPGDANGDRNVDGIDYVIWGNHYNQNSSNGSSDGDFNSDGRVDGIDYVIWLNNYDA